MLKALERFLATSNKGIMLDIERRLQPLLLLCGSIFMAFSVTNFINGSVVMAASDFTLAALVFISNYALQKRLIPPMAVVLFTLVLDSTAVISELVFTGAVSSFLYYYGVLPFFVFYIAGRYIGVVYSFFLIGLVWGTWILAESGLFTLQYTFAEIAFFTPLYAFAAFCAWMFEVEREENRATSYEKGQQHDSLLQVIDEVYYRVDMQGIIQRIGSGITSFTDFSPDEVINHPIAMFYAFPEERDAYVAALKEKGKVTNYPITIKGKSGKLVNISMNSALVFNKNGEPEHIEGVFRDVTAEVAREAERVAQFNHLHKLNSVEEMLSKEDLELALQDVVQELLNIFQAERSFLVPLQFLQGDDANDGYHHIFSENVKGSDFDLNHFIELEEVQFYFSSMPKHKKALNQVMRDTSVFSKVLLESYVITSHAMVVLHTNQDSYWLLGLQNFTEDISAQQQDLFVDISRRIGATLNQLLLQRDLEAVANQAEVASKAKGDFVATISHELRTPLHGIIGLLDLMGQEANQLSTEQQQNLALAQASTQVLRSLIDDVLDLSKIESGNIDIQKQSFQLKQALIDALIPFVMKAREKGVRLNLEMLNVAEVVEGDVQRLRQVLLNLVGNAIKFTNQGYVRIVVNQDDENLFIHIEDSGIGIAREQQAEVFQPFSQVHDVNILGDNLQEKGTGLGTTISQYFIKMMGGELSLRSEPDVGSTMTIRLPLQQVGQARTSVDLQMEDLIQAPKLLNTTRSLKDSKRLWRVLLAEDDPVGRRVAVKRLQRAGFEVETVADGTQAFQKLQLEKFDLLLTDIRMPGLSGMELTKKVRQHEEEKHQERMLIVGLSAYALEEVKKEALEAGMDEFISKPVDMEVLIQMLDVRCQHLDDA